MAPPDPRQRQQMIGSGLMKMAGAVDAANRQGKGIFEGLANGITGIEQQGMDAATKGAYVKQLFDQQDERKDQKQERNKWKEWVTKNASRFGEYGDVAQFLPPSESFNLLSRLQNGHDATDDTKEYSYYLKTLPHGEHPMEFRDWMVLRSPQTNINMPASETAFDKQMGSKLADTALGYQTDAANARQALAAYDEMDRSLNQPGIYTGAGAPTLQALQQVGNAIGVVDDATIGNIDKFEAAANKAIKDEVGSLGSGVSEGDRRFVERANPGLTRSKPGNHLIIEMKRRLAVRKMQIAHEAERYMATHAGRMDYGFFTHLSDWAEQNPIFSDQEKQQIESLSSSSRSTGGGTDSGGYKILNVE